MKRSTKPPAPPKASFVQPTLSKYFAPKLKPEQATTAAVEAAKPASALNGGKSASANAQKRPSPKIADVQVVEVLTCDSNIEGEEEGGPLLQSKRPKRRSVVLDSDEGSDSEARVALPRPGAQSITPSRHVAMTPSRLGKRIRSSDSPSVPVDEEDDGSVTTHPSPATASKSSSSLARDCTSDQDQFHPDLKAREKFLKKAIPVIARESESHAEETNGATPKLSKKDYKAILDKALAINARKGVEAKDKYTPLEIQFLQIKAQNPDAVLFVECGYKYRFFDHDAEIASKVLSIYAHVDRHFVTASIPTHRLSVHLRRLVDAGYKVGIVRQMESAALKAISANKSGPFTRELAGLYTKATMIADDMEPMLASSGDEGPPTSANFLMCINEERADNTSVTLEDAEKVIISLLAVEASTGEVVFDHFPDTFMRTALETRLANLKPSEVVVPAVLSTHTTRVLRQYGAYSNEECQNDGMRLERVSPEQFVYATAMQTVSEFYGDGLDSLTVLKPPSSSPDKNAKESSSTSLLTSALRLPHSVICCLGVLIDYLRQFELQDGLLNTSSFRHFASRSQMTLSATTLSNLDVLRNSSTNGERGTLLWILNNTSTPFGARLLRQWVTHPLLVKEEIEARLDAVSEIVASGAPCLSSLADVLKSLPDLERGLCRIQYKKCSPSELISLLSALRRVSQSVPSIEAVEEQVSSQLLREQLAALPVVLPEVDGFLSAISSEAATQGKKDDLFTREQDYPAIVSSKQAINSVEQELRAYLKTLRAQLKKSNLDYVHMQSSEYLLEVGNSEPAIKLVPRDWIKGPSTKTVSRFHPPLVLEKLKKLSQHREELALASGAAWKAFLGRIAEHYTTFRGAIRSIAILDCLFSLAAVARQMGYVRPSLSDKQDLVIKDGRHPMAEALMSSPFVPNSIEMEDGGLRCLIITGPNMGGKSSFIKQVAMIVMMAQIGSFVPASSARLGIFDAIYTRMGASDDIGKGRSTFMVELQEASQILRCATPRSLLILDELGRGTSTHDGMAIAYATLHYLVQSVKAPTLFVTHYPSLGKLQSLFPSLLHNFHMSFMQSSPEPSAESSDKASSTASPAITFLYKLVPGVASRSFGLNVARLAHLPASLIATAEVKSAEMEREMTNHSSRRNQSRDAVLAKSRGAVLDKSCDAMDVEPLETVQAESRDAVPRESRDVVLKMDMGLKDVKAFLSLYRQAEYGVPVGLAEALC